METQKFYAFWIALICIIVFVFQITFSNFTEALVLNQNSIPQIWRFLTAIFLHGSASHLIYNLFALILFGSILEKIIGSKKFLAVYIVSGILANVISFNFYPSSLGASGAIMGIIGTLAIIRPMMNVWAFGIIMPMALAATFWVIGDVIGAVGYLTGNPMNNTGNIAHLSGIFFGAIFGIIFRTKSWKTKKPQKIDVPEHLIRRWETLYMD